MSAGEYPLLRNEVDGTTFPIQGRLLTFGSARECALRLPVTEPGLMGHLLFRDGRYHLKALSAGARLRVNGSEISGSAELRHGDLLELGSLPFRFCERAEEGPAPAAPAQPLTDLIDAVVSLLRERDSDVFHALVAGVSRLLRCDAARVVEEDESGQRRTIAKYPSQSGLERFSNRAIDWSKDSPKAILLQETDWEDRNSLSSFRKNAVSTVLCVALREAGGIIGYLYMDRLTAASPFTEHDRELCDSLGRLFGEILSHKKSLVRQQEAIARLQGEHLEPGAGIIHSSPAMSKVMELAARVARTDGTVLIRGETGTGKELLAKFLHAHSKRAAKPFLALNCGAIPAELMESELFGHEKGSFTGAARRKTGLFEAAEGGTVLLDEIGDLPLGLQVKLLRVLQEGEITRIGNPQPIRLDVRILAATHRSLGREVQEGRFRQDLFFRLSVLELELPPLRERGQDVLLLADFLLKKYLQQFGLPPKAISPAGRNKLLACNFPGNVRELENVIQKALLLSNGPSIGPDDLQVESGEPVGPGAPKPPITLKEARAAAEKAAITAALGRAGGNISLAAKILEVDRKWLMKLMEESDLKADDFRAPR